MQRIDLLDVDITSAVSATRVVFGALPQGAKGLVLQANFTYAAASATSVKAYVQTSLDGGVTWVDIACFAFTTASARKLMNINLTTPVLEDAVATDGSLTDDTGVNLLGDMLAVKYVSVGTYGAGTNLKVQACATR